MDRGDWDWGESWWCMCVYSGFLWVWLGVKVGEEGLDGRDWWETVGRAEVYPMVRGWRGSATSAGVGVGGVGCVGRFAWGVGAWRVRACGLGRGGDDKWISWSFASARSCFTVFVLGFGISPLD